MIIVLKTLIAFKVKYTSRWIGHRIFSEPRPINLTPSLICFPSTPASYGNNNDEKNERKHMRQTNPFEVRKQSQNLECFHCDQFRRIYLPCIDKRCYFSQTYWLQNTEIKQIRAQTMVTWLMATSSNTCM